MNNQKFLFENNLNGITLVKQGKQIPIDGEYEAVYTMQYKDIKGNTTVKDGKIVSITLPILQEEDIRYVYSAGGWVCKNQKIAKEEYQDFK